MRSLPVPAAIAVCVAVAGLAIPARAAYVFTGITEYARASAGTAAGADYHIDARADASSFNARPAINASRQVAFVYTYSVDEFTIPAVLWAGDTTADGSRRTNPDSISDVSISNTGRVAWSESLNSVAATRGIWSYDLGSASPPSRLTAGPGGTTSWNAVRINNSNQIGYRASGTGLNSYVSTDPTGTTFATHAANNVAGPDAVSYTINAGQSFNDNRQISGVVRVTGAAATQEQLRLFNADGTSTRLAAETGLDPASPIVGFIAHRLNAQGTAAFVATTPGTTGNVNSIWTAGPSGLTQIAIVGQNGISAIDLFAPAINNSGLVAFSGRGTDGLNSIYVWDGTGLTRAITFGTATAAGTTVQTDLGLGRLSGSPIQGVDLNDLGDLAFISNVLNNATPTQSWGRGVWVATVPAPAAGVFAGLGALAAARRRRR